ncbi:17350_t:CDS:2 [Gigaspora rosea]|nr:17350_t:CDS:2 [Gigaspora rosea]
MEVETTTPKSLYEYLEKLESYLLDENIKSFKFSQFHNNELIGRGGFAIVSSAVFQETKYALKDLKVNLIIDDKMIKNIINEVIKLLNKLNHPNINKFYGISRVAKKIIDNQKEKAIANTPQDFISLYEKCWSSSPDQRPTLHKILKQLKKLLNKTPVEFIENHISNKQYINAIIINQGHCTFTFEDLDKSTDLRDVRRRLSTEKDLLLGRQNVYFYDQHGEKISRDHENNYTLEDILIPDGSDFSFYIESDLSKPSFPKIVQLFGLDKGRKFDDGIMNTASQQAFTIQNLHEKDINIQNEYSINIGESNPVYYQTGYIRLTRDDLQVSDEYIKAIEDALDDNKSVEEKRGALNEIGREFGHFWMQDIKLGRIPIQIEEMTDSASTDGSIMYQQIVASSSRT